MGYISQGLLSKIIYLIWNNWFRMSLWNPIISVLYIKMKQPNLKHDIFPLFNINVPETLLDCCLGENDLEKFVKSIQFYYIHTQ